MNASRSGLAMQDNAVATIIEHANAGADLRRRFFAEKAPYIAETALHIAATLARGHKLLLCGNGGSAADCQHVAAEFVNRFMMNRPPLPAIALTTDSSILTAVGNDFSFDLVFAKQVLALGQPGDMLFAISTSGNSPNVIEALRAARERSLVTVGLTGGNGGKMPPLCDRLICVEGAATPLVQEVHLTVEHLLCALTDYYLFENVAALTPYLEKKRGDHGE